MCTAQLDYIGERTYSAVGLYWRKNVCRQRRWINSEILTYRVFGLYRKLDSQIISEIERTAHSDYIGNCTGQSDYIPNPHGVFWLEIGMCDSP